MFSFQCCLIYVYVSHRNVLMMMIGEREQQQQQRRSAINEISEKELEW